MKRLFKSTDPLIEVKDPRIGASYHVSWAKHGCVWRCTEINKRAGTAKLVTPKSGKTIIVKLKDLRHTRSVQASIERSNK